MKKSISCMILCAVMGCSFGGCSLGGESSSNSEHTSSAVTITKGMGEVYPYIDEMTNYLLAPEGAEVARYSGNYYNQAKGVQLAWECSQTEVEKFVLEYGVKSESSRTEITLGGDTFSYKLYNLYKATEYEWSVTATLKNGETHSAKESFVTTDKGPRVMQIDGIYNTRDLGGYMTDSGKRTKQGLLYRGGALLPADIYNSNLTEEGKLYMLENMRIATDLDLRGYGAESNYLSVSPIPGAKLEYALVGGYAAAFSMKSEYRAVFSLLANVEKYPIYMHCTGGADRTGTVSFLLNALLGVAEEDLIMDYEVTTFSIYNVRSTTSGPYMEMFQEFLTKLKAYEGETLKDKTENYMLSIGVTQAEIDSIRAIMLGE